MELNNMLDEYMRDEMMDSDVYKEEGFEAFESDVDSMLILGQPIDDQIRIKNIASFAIPKSKLQQNDNQQYLQGTNSGGESEECEYEDSFESPGKSLTEHNLREFSSITFAHSKLDNDAGGNNMQQDNSHHKPEKTTKRRKKKKRVPPAASLANAMNDKAHEVPVSSSYNTNKASSHQQYEDRGHGIVSAGGGQSMQPISRSGDRNRNGSAVSGSRSSARSHLTPRVNTAGRPINGTSSAGGNRSQHLSQNQYEHQQQQVYRPQQQYHPLGNTPPIYPTHNAGPGSVVSHAPSAARAPGVLQGGAYNASMLQRQLDTALKQVAMYRRENEALQQNLDSAGINEAVERYKALLIEKQHQIVQLESENNGLKSVARYQGKYLAEKAKDTGGVDSIQSHEKQIEIMLIHTRKMKEKVKKLETREEELVAENENLHTQNGRLQRKNAKLKKQVAAAEQYIKEGASTGPHPGPVSTNILDILHASNDTAGTDGGSLGSTEGGAFHPFDSVVSAEPSVIEHHPHQSHHHHHHQTDGYESVGAGHPQQHPHHHVHYAADSNSVDQSQHQHQQQQRHPAAQLPTTFTTSTKNAQLRRRLEEQETQLRKQQLTIEALEKALQTQRGRFIKDIETYKAQAEQAAEEQRRLEAELDKRERFGRNQVSTLKQIRTAYDELSSGYRKLLTASELYDRDTAPPQPLPAKPAEVSPVKPEPEKLHRPSPVRKLAPKAAVISDDDAYLTNMLIPQRPTSSKNSRGTMRAGNNTFHDVNNMTFLTAEEKESDSHTAYTQQL